MIEMNPYRRLARTIAFICYTVAGAVFCLGIFLTLVAATQDISYIPEAKGMSNAQFATMIGALFAVWTVMITLLGWRVQRVFGQHRRTEKPIGTAAVGCLRLSSLGCVLWSLPGALGIIFSGQVLTTGKPIGIPDLFVAVTIIAITITLMLSVAWFISANYLYPNNHERKHVYQTYLNGVQGELSRMADPETRARLQDQTLYVLTKLDQPLKGTLLKDLSESNLLTGSARIVLRNADFRGADLSLSDLPEADLREINLEEARLEGALLFKVNLYKARLKKCNLSRARLQEANLQEADLTEAVLNEAKLRAANLHRTILIKANLQGANLQQANLRYANLEGAVLKDTDLRGADLTGAIVTTAQLQEAKV
jgi:uncharacterized protein YjbI with pentapeptide repeats